MSQSPRRGFVGLSHLECLAWSSEGGGVLRGIASGGGWGRRFLGMFSVVKENGPRARTMRPLRRA